MQVLGMPRQSCNGRGGCFSGSDNLCSSTYGVSVLNNDNGLVISTMRLPSPNLHVAWGAVVPICAHSQNRCQDSFQQSACSRRAAPHLNASAVSCAQEQKEGRVAQICPSRARQMAASRLRDASLQNSQAADLSGRTG